jgi:hypothetical protein
MHGITYGAHQSNSHYEMQWLWRSGSWQFAVHAMTNIIQQTAVWGLAAAGHPNPKSQITNSTTTQRAQGQGPARRKALRALEEANPQFNCVIGGTD